MSAAAERILIAEDERDIADVLEYNLQREGFDTDVFSRGDQALESIRSEPPSLLLLDLMLPGLDGIELCKILKRDPHTARVPIVMLTAKTAEVDRIVGLELGAEDYVTKPFSPREVVLRIKAVLRRSQPNDRDSSEIDIGDLRVDVPAHRVFLEEQEVVLTATEFRLLESLLAANGRVLTRERLLTEAWGYAEDVDSRTVDTHVRRLRRKLGHEAERIETVIGVGYRMRV